jgi:hypothetical protein
MNSAGRANIVDGYTESRSGVVKDTKDAQLISMSNSGGKTMMTFSRALNMSDGSSRDIQVDLAQSYCIGYAYYSSSKSSLTRKHSDYRRISNSNLFVVVPGSSTPGNGSLMTPSPT